MLPSRIHVRIIQYTRFLPFTATLLISCQYAPAPGLDTGTGATDSVPAADIESVARCTADKDCRYLLPDETGCTEPLCDFGFCGVRVQPAGHPCSDSNALTSGDRCDESGECVGTLTECGDGRCDTDREDCYTCPADCECDAGMTCHDSRCVPEPVDGDGVCERLEDCGTSPDDCACDDEHACVDAECMSCEEACDQDHRVCGDFLGCDCGDCANDLECNTVGRCVVPGQCGDGECLKPFEDCATCPVDCACLETQGCSTGVCRACSTICRGIDCGAIDGCDCGQTGPCESCEKGQVVKDCRCICASAGRQCGTVDGCTCGNHDGGCMDRMKCENGLCMPDCDAVCDDVECGAIGNCLCARCTKAQVCYDGGCEPAVFETDEYEPNDYPGDAATLGAFTDADGTPDWDAVGAIVTAEDRDWYTFTVADTWGEVLDIQVTIDGMSEDADLNMMVCYRCDDPPLSDPGLSVFDDAFEVASTINDARCFESRRSWGMPEDISLAPVCGIGFDDSGTVWIKIFPAQKADAKTDYLLGFDL